MARAMHCALLTMDRRTDRVRVLLNPGASRAPEPEALRALLAERPAWRLVELAEGDSLERHVHDAAREGVQVVIAAGGDGTVASVASVLARLGVDAPALGVLPLGTANDLATQLAMPLDVEGALAIFDAAEVRALDAIELALDDGSTRVVVNVANGGFAANVGAVLDSEAKETWGALAYARAAIEAESPTHRVTFQVDDDAPEQHDAVVLAIANGATCGGGVRVAPTADLEDGLFDLVLVSPASAPRLAALAARLRVGKLEDHELLERRVGRALSLRIEPPMAFSLDGELVEQSVAAARVLPGALKVVVGPEYRRGDLPDPDSSSSDESSDEVPLPALDGDVREAAQVRG